MSVNYTSFAPFVDNGLFLQETPKPTPVPVPGLPLFSAAPPTFCSLNTAASTVCNGSNGGATVVSEGSNAFSNSSSNSDFSDSLRALQQQQQLQLQQPIAIAEGKSSVAGPTNLYVASLPASFTDEELYSLFAPFGPIKSSKVMYSRASSNGRSVCRGYGFVLFYNEADAVRAQAQMIGHIVGGNKIQVRRAKSGNFVAPQDMAELSINSNSTRYANAAPGVGDQVQGSAVARAPATVPQPLVVPQQPVMLPTASVYTNVNPAIVPTTPLTVMAAPTCVSTGGVFVGQDGCFYMLVPATTVM